MSCTRERQRLDAAVAALEKLWDQLAAAAPSKKPAIVKKIEAQNDVVDRARADYETCIHKDDLPSTAVSATFGLISFRSNDSRVFFNEADVSRIVRFSGPAISRGFTFDPIVVTRTAVFTIGDVRGSLVPATGAMALNASVTIALLGRTATLVVATSTSPSASPSGLFNPIGRPLAADNSFRLVGTGKLDYPEVAVYGLEYAIAFDGTFATKP